MMKAIVFGLLSVATFVQAKSDWESIVVSVNTTAIEDFYKDAVKFHTKLEKTVKKEKKALGKAIADAYSNEEAKLILNFGNTVVPAVKAYADLLAYNQINDG